MNADVLLQARFALRIEQHRRNAIERSQGRPQLQLHESSITPRSMAHAATVGGAATLGLSPRIGRIAPGYAADLVAWDLPFGRAQGDPAAHVVLQSTPAQIVLVMVDGTSAAGRNGTGMRILSPPTRTSAWSGCASGSAVRQERSDISGERVPATVAPG